LSRESLWTNGNSEFMKEAQWLVEKLGRALTTRDLIPHEDNELIRKTDQCSNILIRKCPPQVKVRFTISIGVNIGKYASL